MNKCVCKVSILWRKLVKRDTIKDLALLLQCKMFQFNSLINVRKNNYFFSLKRAS